MKVRHLCNKALRFYQNIAVWQYAEAAAQQFASLQKAKIRIGTQDLKIASIALTTQATLLTRNIRDYSRIPDMRLEDWTS